jgi:acyl-coenzyme A synthetase/AMP-(fatty) acid ligase
VTSDRSHAFHTSGHTGDPVPWLRTTEQLRAEVTLIADALLGEVEHVVCFAPPDHLFGRLFGTVLPQVRGISAYQHLHPSEPPNIELGKRTLFVCLPSSWELLYRVRNRIRLLPMAVAMHGTGSTTSTTDRMLATMPSTFRAIELFGSTETGGVAHRRLRAHPATPEPWRLLPDVDLVVEPGIRDQLLHVRSPRLARRANMPAPPATMRLDDLVRIVDERHFELLGRVTRLIKVNGRRCRLDHVERVLSDSFPWLDPVCVAVRDPLRGEHYELFYSHKEGDVRDSGLRTRLSDVLRDFPQPRIVHRVEQIPRTVTGKIKVDRLFTAAAAREARGDR